MLFAYNFRQLTSLKLRSAINRGFMRPLTLSSNNDGNLDKSILPQQSSYHIPVMRKECCSYLNIEEGKVFVDCTLGGGGHSQAILENGGKVIAIDQDPDAIKYASNRLKSYLMNGQLEIVQTNFRSIKEVVQKSTLAKQGKVDGVLMDLGVSSYQIDEPTRGFAFGAYGPLDMRMNRPHNENDSQRVGRKAEDVLNTVSTEELADILYNYGEETRSRQIARDIVLSRPLNTTQDLVEIINRITPFKQRPKTLAKCFQALRIYVNDEIGALKDALIDIPAIMNTEGRLVVMSYHSLEDRLIKNLFKYGNIAGDESSLEDVRNPWSLLTKKAVAASEEEVALNRRARSAKLRASTFINDKQIEKIPKTILKYGSYVGKKQAAKLAATMDSDLDAGKDNTS
jgi:16S rRNA (cytosine1402-N4)-methyltransferase